MEARGTGDELDQSLEGTEGPRLSGASWDGASGSPCGASRSSSTCAGEAWAVQGKRAWAGTGEGGRHVDGEVGGREEREGFGHRHVDPT